MANSLRELIAKLPVNAAQVILNRLRTEEEGGCSLPGGLAAREDLRDTELLSRERLRGRHASSACRLAGGEELAASHLSPRLGTQTFENLERHTQLAARTLSVGARVEGGRHTQAV